MRIDLKFLKLIIKLLILLILFVMLFLISSFLYSARYWRDIYVYTQKNITITRIPTISELNLTEYDYANESTTENFDYFDSTTDYYNSSVFGEELLPYKREERDIDYDAPKDKSIDYSLDYDYDQKLNKVSNDETTTVRDVEVIREMSGVDHLESSNKTTQASCHGNATSLDALVHPWIATIFVKNATSQQFDYICDGAILSEKTIVTAARCVLNGNKAIEAGNVLTVLGKTSLLNTGGNERVYRVQSIRIHENFTNQDGVALNDIAAITTDERIVFNANVQTACLIPKHITEKDNVIEAITTAWKISGELTTVKFDVKSYGDCSRKVAENVYCSTYGNDVTFCPSYGGLNVLKIHDQWFLKGVRTADKTDRRFCTDKNLAYTDIGKFVEWIGVE